MSTENQLKKIIYRAVHRGCKETDFLLGDFFVANKNNLSELGLDLCEKFLNEDDMLIYDWILEKIPTEIIYQSLIEKIRKFHGLFAFKK
jgi:antitoxin CptB